MELQGIVSSGLGRAHVFMAQPHYQDQFQSLLGQKAWPGTLNMVVDGTCLVNYIALRQKAGIDTLDATSELRVQAQDIDTANYAAHRVRGFLRDGVSFGGATAFHATLIHSDTPLECAVLIPDLTRHVDVVEVISPFFIREKFGLVDGDLLNLIIH